MIARPDYIERLRRAESLPFIPVLSGIRRCGKSSILALYEDDLLHRGIPEERILRVNMESLEFDELRDYRAMACRIKESLPDGGHLLLDEAA